MKIEEILKRFETGEVSVPTLCLSCSMEWDDDSGYYDHLSGNRDKEIEDEMFSIEYQVTEDDVSIDDGCLLDYSVIVELKKFYNSDGELVEFSAEDQLKIETAIEDRTEIELE